MRAFCDRLVYFLSIQNSHRIIIGSCYSSSPIKCYECKSCNYTAGEVCCEICAKKCHAGHEVTLIPNWSMIRFFCDCGSPNFTKNECLCKPSQDLVSQAREAKLPDETKANVIIDQELFFRGSIPQSLFSFPLISPLNIL